MIRTQLVPGCTVHTLSGTEHSQAALKSFVSILYCTQAGAAFQVRGTAGDLSRFTMVDCSCRALLEIRMATLVYNQIFQPGNGHMDEGM